MRKQSLEFRKEETTFVMRRWLADESCSLVGVGSVGKSNLLHHISSTEVQKHYMPAIADRFKTITLDSNMLGPLEDTVSFRAWAGYELMMHRLYMAFYPFDVLGEDAQNFYTAYQDLQDGTNPLYAYMGLRYLEQGIEFFTRRGWKIVFLFDEFEEFFNLMPVSFFQSLRGLRDSRKQSIAYLTFSREPLSVLIDKMGLSRDKLEPFVELFTGNEYFVGPYNTQDRLDMLNNLVKRHQAQLSSELTEFLLNASGGFAGLLRACFHALATIPEASRVPVSPHDILTKLVQRSAVREECHTLWNGLTPEEQRVLLVVIDRETYHDELQPAMELLIRKRLLRKEPNGIVVEPAVLRYYLHQRY
jgi:hypothetical protein